MQTQTIITIHTPGRGIVDITDEIANQIKAANIKTGLCHIFIQHTSASLCICENYDPLVRVDLESFMQRITPDGDPMYQHVEEGPDDMPSHVRSILTSTFLTVPISQHKPALGRWQSICLWEHRLRSYQRNLVITMQGE